eukprot:1157417-Pelagomonas_calceolata.AAC.6
MEWKDLVIDKVQSMNHCPVCMCVCPTSFTGNAPCCDACSIVTDLAVRRHYQCCNGPSTLGSGSIVTHLAVMGHCQCCNGPYI